MKPKPCVRCGSRPRGEELFVCYPCSTDPVKLDEVRQAQKATDITLNNGERSRAERTYLVKTFHWHGHWGPRG